MRHSLVTLGEEFFNGSADSKGPSFRKKLDRDELARLKLKLVSAR
jgi:hypothetical protein